MLFKLIHIQLNEYESDLFGVKFVELCLAVLLTPQAEHLGLGAVSHVYQFLVPPPVANGSGDAT